MRTVPHWIGGRPDERDAARYGDVYDPSAGEVQARVPMATAEVVAEAVAAARGAFPAWRDTPLTERMRILFRFRELFDARRDELKELISSEHGKVLADASGEVRRGQEVAEFACGLGHLLKGAMSEGISTDVDSWSLRQPLGVVAGITPFNFPVMVPMWMYPVAIACGNTFVLKPSEKDPSASILMARILADAGLPDGVFNVVHGDKEAVDALLEHPDVAAVSSVGSTPVARHIYTTASANLKRVQALGGAKNHMMVLPDADLDLAADSAVSAAYGSAGERCMAISVVVAVGPVADPLVEAIGQRTAALTVGPSLDHDAEMGPLVTAAHRDRVESYVETGVDEGARLRADGRGLKVDGHESGFFLGPCLFDEVTPEMTIYRDEIFGPVLIVVRADTYDEGLAVINGNPYGNGTAIFTRDGAAARRFQREVTAGMVGINVPIPVPLAFYPFGGWKDSLYGDLHVHGTDGVRFYTRGKYTVARWPAAEDRGVDLGFPSSD